MDWACDKDGRDKTYIQKFGGNFLAKLHLQDLEEDEV
jgi:hypothetical protein